MAHGDLVLCGMSISPKITHHHQIIISVSYTKSRDAGALHLREHIPILIYDSPILQASFEYRCIDKYGLYGSKMTNFYPYQLRANTGGVIKQNEYKFLKFTLGLLPLKG